MKFDAFKNNSNYELGIVYSPDKFFGFSFFHWRIRWYNEWWWKHNNNTTSTWWNGYVG